MKNPFYLVVSVLFIALVLSYSTPSHADHYPIEKFGYNSTNQVSGTIPLLTIMVDYSDVTFRATHTPVFYERLLFDTGLAPRIAGSGGYFSENSLGKFAFNNVGILGPYANPDSLRTTFDESLFHCASGNIGRPYGDPSTPYAIPAACGAWNWNSAKREWENYSLQLLMGNAVNSARDDGFPFSSYDTDNSGYIESDELVILVIGAAPDDITGNGGSVRNVYPWPLPVSDDVSIINGIANIGEDASVTTIAHELTHVLHSFVGGAYELYGAGSSRGFCLNQNFTLMSCTITRNLRSDLKSYHLDPFSKMKLGWLQPTILHASDNACIVLDAMEDLSAEKPQAYIIYDETRGPDEFFMLEFRQPEFASGNNYDGGPWYIGRLGLPDRGLGIWYVQINDRGWPFNINSLDGTLRSDGTPAVDTTVFLLPPGQEDKPVNWGKIRVPARNGLWDNSNGPAMPVWLNGDPTGITMTIITEGTLSNGKKRLWVQLGDEPVCFDIPPISTPMEYFKVAEGIERWMHTDFTLERKIPYPVPTDSPFSVEWSVVANNNLTGSLLLQDHLPQEFLLLSQGGSQLNFVQLPPEGQMATLSYTAQADNVPGGGFLVQTELTIIPSLINDPLLNDNPPPLNDNPQQQVITFESHFTLAITEVPVPNLPQDTDLNDIDKDGVPTPEDQCPIEDATKYDADKDGCLDNYAVMADWLTFFVKSGQLDPKLGKRLMAIIDKSEKSADAGHICPAVRKLGSFIAQIKAQTEQRITLEAATMLIEYVNNIALQHRDRAVTEDDYDQLSQCLELPDIQRPQSSSAQDNNKIILCHIPAGKPENSQTITISENDLEEHLAHGDYISACLNGTDDTEIRTN